MSSKESRPVQALRLEMRAVFASYATEMRGMFATSATEIRNEFATSGTEVRSMFATSETENRDEFGTVSSETHVAATRTEACFSRILNQLDRTNELLGEIRTNIAGVKSEITGVNSEIAGIKSYINETGSDGYSLRSLLKETREELSSKLDEITNLLIQREKRRNGTTEDRLNHVEAGINKLESQKSKKRS